MSVAGPSQHPDDQLIRELVDTRRAVEPGEVERIVERMATVPFDQRRVRVRLSERGLTYLGRELLARDDSLFVHLVRRVLIDRQWAMGTTVDRYLDDLRRGTRAADARLAVYARRGGYLAAAVTPTSRAVAEPARGSAALPELVIIYSADRSMIVTGYQISSVDASGIPEDARWLR